MHHSPVQQTVVKVRFPTSALWYTERVCYRFMAMKSRWPLVLLSYLALVFGCFAAPNSLQIEEIEPVSPFNTTLKRDFNHFIMSGYQITSFRSEDCEITLPTEGPHFQYDLLPFPHLILDLSINTHH